MFAFCAKAQESGPVHLSGVWEGWERDGSQAGELAFPQGDKLICSGAGITMTGRYEIDSSKSPNLLVFYPDAAPGQKVYASIEIKSATEIRLSHLCDGTPAALARQSIVTYIRK